MKIIRLLAFNLLFISLYTTSRAQININWQTANPSSEQKAEISSMLLLPQDARFYKASFLHTTLESVSGSEVVQVTLPIGMDGAEVKVHFVYDPVMGARDQQKFKEIRTFKAFSTEGTPISGRAGISPTGFYGVFELNGKQIMIRPGAVEQDMYVVYDLGRKLSMLDFSLLAGCGTETHLNEIKRNETVNLRSDDKRMRNFTIAISCTSGYADQVGRSEGQVMASVVEVLNLLNYRYNVDFGIKLNLLDGTSQLFNLDPHTDYFVNETKGLELLQQNQDFLDSLIDNSSYDLAQVFTRGCSDVGGVVWGRTCVSDTKARGVSCRTNDSDYFFTTFKHEVGHQFSGGHTFNACNGSTQYNPFSSFEPGAGSTILSYGDNCGSDNVGERVDYFHVANIIEVNRYVKEIENKCGTWGAEINHTPVGYLSMPEDKTIPILTPFELEGGATDDDKNLTFNWEQYDLGEGEPLGTNFETGPLFVSQAPGGVGHRLFPSLSTINSGIISNRERLPEVSREMNFKMTVRDNNPNVGAQAIVSYKFDVTDQAGPFKVTFPDAQTDTSFTLGQYVEITWDVANTDQFPVSCKNVNILFSTTNGNTWSDTLVANTPNDGRESVMMPRTSGRARFKVKAADNIFLDLSGKPLKIVQPSEAGYSLDILPHDISLCKNSIYTLTVKSVSWKAFNSPVKISVFDSGHPAFKVIPLKSEFLPVETMTLDVDVPDVIDAGTYQIRFMATSDQGDTLFRTVTLTIADNDQNISGTISPVANDQYVTLHPVFAWDPVENTHGYQLQLATDPAFSSLILNVSIDSEEYLSEIELNKATIYYWRVRSLGECGYGRWTAMSIFRTESELSNSALHQINNKILKVKTNEKKPALHEDLYYVSELNQNESLKYTLLSEPEHGALYLDNARLKKGDTFTQENVDAGKFVFSAEELDYQGEDGFAFLVSDISNLFIGPENFIIDIRESYPSGTSHINMDAMVDLVPNPTSGLIDLKCVGMDLKEDVEIQILDIRGVSVMRPFKAQLNLGNRIDLTSLSSGVYLIVVQSGNYIAKKRLVKI